MDLLSAKTSLDQMKVARHTGRAYQCLRCINQTGKEVIDRKSRVEEHVMKWHLSLDQVPYFCRLCLFRCKDRKTLYQHVNSYARHRKMAAEREVIDSSTYLVENPRPYVISSDDYAIFSPEDSQQIFLKRGLKGQVEQEEDIVARSFREALVDDTIDTETESLFDCLQDVVPKPITASHGVAHPYSQGTFGPTNSFQCVAQPMVSLLPNGRLSTIPATVTAPAVPEALNTISVIRNGPAYTVRPQPEGSDVHGASKVGTYFQQPTSAPQTSWTMCQPQTTLPLLSLRESDLPATAQILRRDEEVVENLLPQLLGSTTEKRDVSAPPQSKKRARSVSPVPSSSSSSSSGDSVKVSIGIMEKSIQEAVDKNARAIRCLEKTIHQQNNMLNTIFNMVKVLYDSESVAKKEREKKECEKKDKRDRDQAREEVRRDRRDENKENKLKSTVSHINRSRRN